MEEENKQVGEVTLAGAVGSRRLRQERKRGWWGRKTLIGKIGWVVAGALLLMALAVMYMADVYRAQVRVIEGENRVGVNPTTERLDFGDLSTNTAATRVVTLQAGGVDTFISVWKFGEIAELIDVSRNNFVITSGEEVRLEFELYMPVSATPGKELKGQVWIFKIPVF